MTVDDEPDRDPLAGPRSIVRAVQAASDWREVVALAESLDINEARLALVALGVDALAARGRLEPPAEEPDRGDDTPEDPFGDTDWLARGRTTMAALVELSPLGLYRGLNALSEAQMRAALAHAVFDELVRRELARQDREAPEEG